MEAIELGAFVPLNLSEAEAFLPLQFETEDSGHGIPIQGGVHGGDGRGGRGRGRGRRERGQRRENVGVAAEDVIHEIGFRVLGDANGVQERGRGRGRGRGRNRRGRGRSATGPVTPPGWIRPEIGVDRASPVATRPRNLFSTPPPSPDWRGVGPCGHTWRDFYPGNRPPSEIVRQMDGQYYTWLHECGNPNCPFTETPEKSGIPIGPGGSRQRPGLSPGEHRRVDHTAFPRDVYVLVRLLHLGYTPSDWGDLEHFSGKVVHRYYEGPAGEPYFTVDFGGGIGMKEVPIE